MTEEKEPTPLGGWPCDRRDAHGPHHVTERESAGDGVTQVYEPCGEFDCPGVQAHPATMIGRTWRPT